MEWKNKEKFTKVKKICNLLEYIILLYFFSICQYYKV